MKHIAGCKTRP